MISPAPSLHTSSGLVRLGALLVVFTITVLAGCSPTPAPTPTATPAFTSEEEAFAAAEETYRAYNDALNAVDPADSETFEATYVFSAGTFEKADRENFSTMYAEGYTIEGDAVVTKFVGQSVSPSFDQVVALICIDVSDVKVWDATGASVINPDRPDIYEIKASFKRESGVLLIDSAGRVDGETCAS